MMEFKFWLAGILNALLGQIALLQHARWVFERPDEARQIVEKRLSQITTKEGE
jgi:hypothetical protein